MNAHYNVVIATPGRNMESEYVKSLVKTLSYLDKEGISYIYLNEYSSSVSAAREATIMNSKNLNIGNSKPGNGDFTYDKIFWIDSDIGWEINDFMSLYESNKEIVSGLYFNENMIPMFAVNLNSEKEEKDKMEFILKNKKEHEIDAVGFGFICVKNGVFENMKRPWFQTNFVEIILNNETFSIPEGEDFSWCRKAKESGFKIYLNSSINLSHYKKVQVRLDKNEK